MRERGRERERERERGSARIDHSAWEIGRNEFYILNKQNPETITLPPRWAHAGYSISLS